MAIKVLLRPAAEADRETLGALKLRASLGWGGMIEELLELPEARELSSALIPYSFVAEVRGIAAGFATVTVDGTVAELEEIFVEPPLWRHGIGRRLIEEAASRAASAGAEILHVIANPRALNFYEASGFRTIGQVMTLLEPALSMQRHIGRQTTE